MKVRPKLAVLDVAGTTLDVGDVIPAALRAAFEPLGETLEDSDIAGVRGRSKREAVERLVAKLNPPPEHPTSVSARTWDRFREELRQRLPGSVHPIPGAAEAIAWLRVEVGPVWLTSGFDRETLDDLMRVGRLGSAADRGHDLRGRRGARSPRPGHDPRRDAAIRRYGPP
jgi:phosphoglycolate phosphatase-like HAD superfamily hydrolase